MNIEIGRHIIGTGRTYVIAEIGNNHNGSFERAIQMIDLAADMGADCAKFQMRHLHEVYRQRTLRKDGEDLGTEYVLDLLRRFELSVEEHRRIADHCAEKGILYLCTQWDARTVDILQGFGLPAYKVASADLTNLEQAGLKIRPFRFEPEGLRAWTARERKNHLDTETP